MRMHLIAAVVGFSVIGVGAGAAPVSAQTLADLAQKVEESRKAAQKGTKTYTNADAGNVPAATAPSGSGGGATAPTPGAAAGAATGATAGATGGQTGQTAPAGGAKDEAYYGTKLKDLRGQLDQDRALATAVQTQVNSLTTDFVNRDDPAQRSVIEQDRNRAMSELARLQKQIETDQKAIADFEEEARRANVPPGWLR